MSKSNEYIQLIISIIGFGVTCGIVSYNSDLFLIFILLVLGFFITISILRIYKRRSENKAISNANVNKKCFNLCNEIHKIMRFNARKIDKVLATSKEEKLRKKRKELILSLKQKINKTKKDINYLDNEETCRAIIETVTGLDRVLLLCEQYDFRIAFGKYIAKYSFNDSLIQKANIDFIGWSYILKGKTSFAKKAILKGIEQVDEYVKDPFLSEEKKYEALFKKVRAYRHLGSDHNLYSKEPLEAYKYLETAEKLLNEEELSTYYKKHYPRQFEEMMVGIEYGKDVCHLYEFKNGNKMLADEQDYFPKLRTALESIQKCKKIAKEFPNKHRYVKFLILENSIYQEISQIKKDKLPLDLKDIDLVNNVNSNMEVIEKHLNLSIYNDECMIAYLEQKLNVFYKTVKERVER